MPLRLVVFDFDQTLSAVHVYNSLAGGTEAGLPGPAACSELGQLSRVLELSHHPQLQQQGGFAAACFGGLARVGRLAAMLEQLRDAGVECMICSRGLVGPLQKLLDQLGLLQFFSEVYANIGDTYGQTGYDREVQRAALGEDIRFLGTQQQSQWSSKRQVVEIAIRKRGLSREEVLFVDDQAHEIKSMQGACRSLQVYPPRGIGEGQMSEILRHAQRQPWARPAPRGPTAERRGSSRTAATPSPVASQGSFLAYSTPPGKESKGKWLPALPGRKAPDRGRRALWCCPQ
ncbi:unnamed protein product [Effrenium voratum]|uniref:Uncharacterized protein n=1 Tax=Effrenium voratum TaxID=2562239 RepID=A0AA36JCS9_9DINO|nr:unnamed protein product [Effrenium voratum]